MNASFFVKTYFSYSFEAFEIDWWYFILPLNAVLFIHLRSKERFCVCLFCLQFLCRDSILLYHSCEEKGIFFHLASGRWVWKVLKVKATKWVVKKAEIYDKLSVFLEGGGYWKRSTSIIILSILLPVFTICTIATDTLQNRTLR